MSHIFSDVHQKREEYGKISEGHVDKNSTSKTNNNDLG